MSDVVSPTTTPSSSGSDTISITVVGVKSWWASVNELWTTKKYWIIGGIVLVVIVIILGVWYYHYRKKKRQAEEEKTSLEEKKKSSRREPLRNIKLSTKQKEVTEKQKEKVEKKPVEKKPAEKKVEENPQPTEDDFNTGVQLLDRTVKGFKDAFSDYEKTYQSMTEKHVSLEQQQKLTGKIEYILSFLRSNATHVIKLGQMLYRDGKVLDKTDEWIQEHIEVKVEYVQDHFEQALQMIQQLSSNVEEQQPSGPSEEELEVILEEDEEQA